MCVVAAGAKAKPAAAARGMLVGVFDPNRPFDTPDTTFPTLVNLRAQIIRVNLNWNEVATKRPLKPTDPADPAYDWSRYDPILQGAKRVYGEFARASTTASWNFGRTCLMARLVQSGQVRLVSKVIEVSRSGSIQSEVPV